MANGSVPPPGGGPGPGGGGPPPGGGPGPGGGGPPPGGGPGPGGGGPPPGGGPDPGGGGPPPGGGPDPGGSGPPPGGGPGPGGSGPPPGGGPGPGGGGPPPGGGGAPGGGPPDGGGAPAEGGGRSDGGSPSDGGGAPAEGGDRPDGGGPSDGGGDSQDYTHLFRSEALVSDVDLRVDVAEKYSRYVAGNEDSSLEVSVQGTKGNRTVLRGSRDRTVGEYEHVTDGEEIHNIADSVVETVHGGVRLEAAVSAESIVGGAYVNTIAGPYLRLAAWVDFLVWGGWAEADVIRAELSYMMIRSHVGYAHAAGVRVTMASRLVDDFVNRTENFGIMSQSGNTYQDVGMPGGGIVNEA